MNPRKRRPLGELLIERNLLLPEQLEPALARSRETGRRLGQVLLDMGLLTYGDLRSALSDQTGVPHLWLRKGLIDPRTAALVPREKAEASRVMPMFLVRGVLTLAMADPADLMTIDDIERMSGRRVQPVKCRAEDIALAIEEHYGRASDLNAFVESFDPGGGPSGGLDFEDLGAAGEDAEGAQIINLVNRIIGNAIEEDASDIHIEPDAQFTRVRHRIDGLLREVMTPSSQLHAAMISRIKVMARLDIAERRVPQDGRVHVRHDGRELDLRVSTMPTVLGERVVMRLLDQSRMVLDLEKIGLNPETLERLKALLTRPNGLLLVTGPTGSGKSTTLYCGLNLIRSIDRNIITIEDPVEYQLEMVNQVQVNEDQGLTFAKALRSVLRQDPDVVMVGEIRDRETAEVAVQASLTGHLVLSTLHTNESAGAIARLIEMGVEPYLLTSALIGVVAQRLMRLVCPRCKTGHFPAREELARIGWKGPASSFVTGPGCDACHGLGYRGRTGIYELLTIDDSLRRLVLTDPSTQAIRAYAAGRGMRMLWDEGLARAAAGETSLEEVMRVVFMDDAEPAAVDAA